MKRPLSILALLSVWMAIPAVALAQEAGTDAGSETAAPESLPVTTTTIVTTSKAVGTAAPQTSPVPMDEGWFMWAIRQIVQAYREGRWNDLAGLLLSLSLGLFFYGKRKWPVWKGYVVWDKLSPLTKTWCVLGLAVGFSVLANALLGAAPLDTVLDNAKVAGTTAVTSWHAGLKILLDPERKIATPKEAT